MLDAKERYQLEKANKLAKEDAEVFVKTGKRPSRLEYACDNDYEHYFDQEEKKLRKKK